MEKQLNIGNIGLPGMIIILVIVLVLFGRGRIAGIMGEMGKGMSSFKRGVEEGKKQVDDEKIESAKDVTPEETADSKVKSKKS